MYLSIAHVSVAVEVLRTVDRVLTFRQTKTSGAGQSSRTASVHSSADVQTDAVHTNRAQVTGFSLRTSYRTQEACE